MPKTVLLLGAGLVARPMVRYILEKTGFGLVCATRTVEKAEEMIEGHKRGKAVALNVDDAGELEKLISGCDLAVSLVPWNYHPAVARLCIKHSKDMVTTSYVRDEMRSLDGAARKAGIVILNEAGLDPGIDHMSAMKIIHEVKARGGRIASFESMCGALPSPTGSSNPFGYKFSWSPRGVLLASRNPAKFIRNGKTVEIPGKELFANYRLYRVEGAGWFEDYPNRDSTPYMDVYGIGGAETMYRGTLRNHGWCETMLAAAALGFLDDSEAGMPRGAATYAAFTRALAGAGPKTDIGKAVAKKLGCPAHSAVVKRLEWLGLFGADSIPADAKSPLDAFAGVMFRKLELAPPDTDMTVMQHEFRAEYSSGRKERIFSTLVDTGVPGGDTSIARTVSLPAAIGVKLILDGEIREKGVCIPVIPEIYKPILAELEGEGIRMKERAEQI